MKTEEFIPNLINRIRGNNTNNELFRKKTRNELLDIRHNYYKLLDIINSEINSITKNLPVLDNCDEADANTIVRYYGQASKIKALNESFDLVIEAIKELNLVISGKT